MKSKKFIINVTIIFLLALSINGCEKKSQKLSDVEKKVNIIQHQYNSEEFELIYDQASEGFKKVATKKGFVKFMRGKFNYLGKFTSSKILFSKEKDGVIVNVTYISVYEKYTLAENITFKDEKNGNGLRLLQYTVDTGGKIVPVTKTENSMRVDIKAN